jgi:2-octaprenyl-6-methoxyphenol hydroxylase
MTTAAYRDMANIGGIERYEAIVVGGGPAGLTAAIALGEAGIETALIRKAPRSDNRTTALLLGSVTALETLGVWQRCAADAAPLKVMRLIDDTARLIRAPEVAFSAAEIGCEAFGYNIENRHLMAALEARAAEIPALVRIDAAASSVEPDEDDVTVTLADGARLRAQLVIGADGANSLARAGAGIETNHWSYPQVALTCNLSHTRPHADTSTEFHTGHGPFTLVPLPCARSSLVCVVSPRTADELSVLDHSALSEEMERRAHSILGRMTVEPGRGIFPLAATSARQLGARRVALIGEAAHVLPPIGAQGLNLGLRDAATISELAVTARRDGGDVGAPELLGRYDSQRRADVATRSLAVDVLNRTLLTDFLPVQWVRGLGLYLLDRIGPLRRALMNEGISPTLSAPRLMRGQAL